MQFINPIEILGLSDVNDTLSIDNESLKKAKRKLFADIDLSDDNLIAYHGIWLSKSDCEKAIDELGNDDYKEFYLYLANYKPLNKFLVNGEKYVFNNFRQDSIFKLPEFIKFISPFFARQFDKALLSAFENANVQQLKPILNTAFLVSQSDINIAYKSVTNSIQYKIDEINKITKSIKQEDNHYDESNVYEILELVKSNFPTESLNCLPQYFESQILKVAKSINFLQLSIWDSFGNTQVPNDLLAHILTLNISGLDKPTFENNYKIVKKKNDERIEQEKNSPILNKYAQYLILSKIKLEEFENKTISSYSISNWVNSNLSISEVNNLPNVFDEIRNTVALSLRSMSVKVWNTSSDIDAAISLITKANSITGLKIEIKNNIVEVEKKLSEIKNNIKKVTTKSQAYNNGNNINWSSIFGILLVVFIIAAIFYSSNKKKSNYSSPNSNEYPSNNNSSNNANTNSNSSSNSSANNITPEIVESKYKGFQLNNGDSPLDGCFGKGIYGGNATLTIKNGSTSDAIVCLYSIANGRTIRNEYVQKNSNFTMSNISQGNYKIRVFYGNDWNPNITNSCDKKGNFESDIHFTEFDGSQYFEDNGINYTIATITLYSVIDGNASSSAIDPSTFFTK